jgi:hypothetical protein
MTFQGPTPVRSKLIVNNKNIDQVNKFKFTEYTISYFG